MESAIFKDQAVKFLEQLEREHRDLSAQIIAFKRAFKLGHGLSDELIDERRHGSQWQQLVTEDKGKNAPKEIDERWEQYVEEERRESEEVPFIADKSRNKWQRLAAKTNLIRKAIQDSHNNIEIQDMIYDILRGGNALTTQELADILKEDGVKRNDPNFNRLIGSLCYGLSGQGKIFRDESGDWMLVGEDEDE